MAHMVTDSQRPTTSARRAPELSFLQRPTSRPTAEARPDASIGLIGTGEMTAAIAERLVDAGFPVTLHGASNELLDEGLARFEARLDARVRNGELTRAERDRRARLVSPTCWYIAMSSADIVMVCDHECEDTIPTVFAALDRVMKRGATLATTAMSSTKTGNSTRRRGDVVEVQVSRLGHDMRLVELESDARTAEDVVAAVMGLASVLDRTRA
jgi:3-hydroxyacyl-CoA dehydrogenase